MNRPKQLTPSWDLTSKSMRLVVAHWEVFVFLAVLPMLLNVLGSVLATGFITPELQIDMNQKRAIGIGLVAVSTLWTLINIGPYVHYQLDVSRDKKNSLGHYYKIGLRDTPRVFATYLVVAVTFTLGLIAFIVPGFIALRSFIMAPYYLIDKKLTIVESLKQSRAASKPVKNYIWGTIVVQLVVNFSALSLGLIPVVGIVLEQIVVLSISFLLVLRYRTIEPK